jgi:hypothetical protein
MFEWVPSADCGNCTEDTGTPSGNLHPVVPGRSRYKFYKDAPTYEDREERRY